MKAAVLIPCYNEEGTIGKVVRDFRQQLPDADIYVYDNNSIDDSRLIATAEGAIVRSERKQGKGNVVRAMFRDIDADIYIMVDGDDTYPANAIHELMNPILQAEADMVIGDRLSNGSYTQENKRPFHDLGNRMVRGLINRLFQAGLQDIMTGYRVFNRVFVKNVVVLSEGFEIETEMTLNALDKQFRIIEVPIDYRDRPEGSFSKLNTVRDGVRVLRTVFSIFKNYKPLMFFGMLALFFFVVGLIVGLPPILEFVAFHYVYKIPSAILAVGFMMLASISLTCGLILDTIVHHHRELHHLLITQSSQRAPEPGSPAPHASIPGIQAPDARASMPSRQETHP